MHPNARIKSAVTALIAGLRADLKPSLPTFSLAIALLPLSAQVQAQEVEFNISAQPLESALLQLSKQSGLQMLYSPSSVKGIDSQGVTGKMPAAAAVEQLLRGTNLGHEISGNTVTLRPAAPRVTSADGRTSPEGDIKRLGLVRVEAVTEGTGSYTTGLTNTATRLDLSLRDTPQSVTVVTRERIEDQSLTEISEVLEQTAGVFVADSGPLGSDNNFVYARGFPLQNYQVDGTPRSTRFGFRNDISDMALFDRVEVLRGASGLMSGVGEPSGAINLVRKLPTPEFQAYASSKLGSWDHYRVEGDVSGPVALDGAVRARAVGAWQDSGDFVDRLKLEKKVAYGIVETDVGSATLLSLGIEYQEHETKGGGRYGIPIYFPNGEPTNFSRSTNLAADWSYHTREHLSLVGGAEHYFDNGWRLELDLEHSRREYEDVMPSIFLADEINFYPYRFGGKPRQNSARLHAVGPYKLFGREHELVVGVSYDYFKNQSLNYNAESRIISYDEVLQVIRTGNIAPLNVSPSGGGSRTYEWQNGAYLTTRVNVADPVHVMLGARVSNWKTRRDRFNAANVETRGIQTEVENEVTPYAGVVVDVTGAVSLYSSYTDIFQPANVYDANGNLLDPAVGSNLEGGVKLALFEDKLNISGAYYRTEKDNVPEYVPGPGGAANYGPTGQFVYAGVDGTKTTGIELEVSGQITPRWQISGGYSHANPRDSDDQRRLTYIPTDTFKLFSTYKLGGLLDGLTLGGNLRWQNEIDYEFTEAAFKYYEQGDFAVVDLMAEYQFTPKLSATLNVNNLFDKTYFTDISASGWYGTPRSAFITVRLDF